MSVENFKDNLNNVVKQLILKIATVTSLRNWLQRHKTRRTFST